MSILPLTIVTSTQLQIPGLDPWYADPHDPALSVMTDFRERASVTVVDTAPIDDALEHMRHTGVRCAFAIDAQSCVVLGLITAYDISGEKPMQYMLSRAMRRSEVLVRDIMQEIWSCRVADIRQIERATVFTLSESCVQARVRLDANCLRWRPSSRVREVPANDRACFYERGRAAPLRSPPGFGLCGLLR